MELTWPVSVERVPRPSPPSPPPSFGRERAPETGTATLPDWQRALPETMVRLHAVEAAAAAAVEEELTADQRGRAQLAANQLAETVMAFGYVAAAQRARSVERMLAGTQPLTDGKVLQLCEDAVALRQELAPDRSPASATLGDTPGSRLVVYSSDAEWSEQVRTEAGIRGLDTFQTRDLATLRQALDATPDAVVLDLSGDTSMAKLLEGQLPVATTAVVSTYQLADRLALVDAGIGRVLQSDTLPRDAVDAVMALLGSQRLEDARVILLGEQGPLVEALEIRVVELGAAVRCHASVVDLWEELVDHRPNLIVTATDDEEVTRLARLLRVDGRCADLPVIAVTADGTADPTALYRAGVDDVVEADAELTQVIELIRGRLIRSRLRRSDAEVDQLTGLPNETGARRSVERLTALARRQERPLALAVVQIDGFGRLNELYGRNLGDDALQATAAHLRQAFRGEDVAARLGASEFLLALYDSSCDTAAERIRSVVQELREVQLTAPNGVPVRLTLSAGIASLPLDGREPRAVRRAASEALRHARASGGDLVLTTAEVDEDQRDQVQVDVVVIEENDVVASMLTEAFASRGWEVERIADGQTALERLGGAHPSLRARVIVLDVDLPGPDGYVVLRRLAGAGVLRHSRVIVVTSSATEAQTLAAFEAGATDHVSKPFSLPVLVERVRTALVRIAA